MSIRVEKKDGKETYFVRVHVHSKCRTIKVSKQRRGVETKAKAKEIEKTLLRSAVEELHKKESQGLFWGQLVDEWEIHLRNGYNQGRPIATTTAQDHVAALRMYTKHWFKLPAAQIGRNHVRQTFNLMDEKKKSAGRKKAVKTAINSCFEWGLDTGKIKGIFQSPTHGIKIKVIEHKKPEILNLKEIKLLLKTARDFEHEWYPVWAMALLTGMRLGELFALEWKDIDWESKRFTVSKSYNGRLKIIKSTKAGDWRDIPISSQLECLLKEIRASHNDTQYVLPRVSGWKRGNAAYILQTFCKGAGLKPVKFHTLRACMATQLIRDGVAPAIVMKVGGWSGMKAMQRYIRLAGIEVEGATEGLKLLTPRETMENVASIYRD